MYTGTADHSLTAELVSLVDVPVIASGDVTSHARAQAVLATTGASAVMVGRAAQGNPWALREILGEPAEPTREEVVAELLLFMRETVRELGEFRATGFLKKFYGWYLGRGRFPRPFKQELVMLPTLDEVETRLLAAAPGAARCSSGSRRISATSTRCCSTAADLDLRRRLSRRATVAREAPRASGLHLTAARRMSPTTSRSSSRIRSPRLGRQPSARTVACVRRSLARHVRGRPRRAWQGRFRSQTSRSPAASAPGRPP